MSVPSKQVLLLSNVKCCACVLCFVRAAPAAAGDCRGTAAENYTPKYFKLVVGAMMPLSISEQSDVMPVPACLQSLSQPRRALALWNGAVAERVS